MINIHINLSNFMSYQSLTFLDNQVLLPLHFCSCFYLTYIPCILLILLNQKPSDSRVSCQISNLKLTPPLVSSYGQSVGAIFLTHYVAIYKTIYVYYKSHNPFKKLYNQNYT